MLLIACASILGIEEKPLRSSVVEAGPEAGDAPDTSTCETNESLGCANACPHEACEDFDVDGGRFVWKTPFGSSFGNVGDASQSISAPGNSPENSLFSSVTSSGKAAYTIYAHTLNFADHHPGQTFEGVRVGFDMRLETLEFDVAGNDKTAVMFGFINGVSNPPKGVALGISPGDVFLDVSDNLFEGTGVRDRASLKLASDPKTLLQRAWVRGEVFLGGRDRAIREGFSACSNLADTTAPLIAAVRLSNGLLGAACIVIPSTFGPPIWAQSATMGVGGLMFSAGVFVVRIDNVVADFFASP